MGRWFVTTLIWLAFLAAGAAAQSTPAPYGPLTGQEVPLPLSARPKLSMREALKIADHYIKREHIRISAYWLYEARYTSYGRKEPGKDKEPCWYFWWVSNKRGSNDDEVMIIVFMDGEVTQASMFARPQ